MEYNNLLELIKTISESNISGFQYEDGNTKLVITTGGNPLPGAVQSVNAEAKQNAEAVTVQKAAEVVKQTEAADNVAVKTPVESEKKQPAGNIVKSPLVGTFYAAPAEDAEPFVQIGDVVKKGQTLAIVEAMKLMNDIEAEFDGKILEIFVENGDIVEYGQPLFAIG
ncbi:MAG: acetyl-CoA carboxylase biotin carboxyl carrier protein [Lachnospiraceae bacterium]|nr:acetyl-CoA carboxylase biotin carboxyl carrier protein [Lachnospiraceae bacterium]MBQ7777114.1 acetyl-CoA carboxylase biotin carboxyl carrier protein [Lachnospiraceae bacterium]